MSASGKTQPPLYARLWFQVILGIIAGVALGYLNPGAGAAMKPLGDGFVKLIRMMIAPIIFGTVVVGIGKMGDMKEVGRIGLRLVAGVRQDVDAHVRQQFHQAVGQVDRRERVLLAPGHLHRDGERGQPILDLETLPEVRVVRHALHEGAHRGSAG